MENQATQRYERSRFPSRPSSATETVRCLKADRRDRRPGHVDCESVGETEPNQNNQGDTHGTEEQRSTCPWRMGGWIIVEQGDSAPAEKRLERHRRSTAVDLA